MFKSLSRRVMAMAAVLPLTAGMAACGSTSADTSQGSPVVLDFWGWAPGYDKSAELFNATHKDVRVQFTKTPSGNKGGYQQMLNAVQAGNAPCLAQAEFGMMPSFLVSGALEDVSKYAEADQGKFVRWTWNQVKIGGEVYGAPVDSAPMALFYRKDVFAKFGLSVPTTWDQYAGEAARLHTADPSYFLGTMDPGDVYALAGLAWQKGAHWFDTSGDKWEIAINDDATKQVAQFWQNLLTNKLVKQEPAFDTAWFNDVNTGHVAAFPAAVWASALVEQNAPAGRGQWAVAPLPQWQAGQNASGNIGGSATAVLKGCKNPEQAWEFAAWMSTDTQSLNNLIKQAGIYPAASNGLDLPAVNSPYPYFSGQNIWTVFKDGAAHTNDSWRWGPTMPQVATDYSDEANAAVGTGGSLSGALDVVQRKTIDALRQKGLSVAGN